VAFLLPPLRTDLEFRKHTDQRFPWLLEDSIQRIRLPLDSFGYALTQQLLKPISPNELFRKMESFSTQAIDPLLIYRYVLKLQKVGYLEGLRAVHNREIQKQGSQTDTKDLSTLPLSFVAGLQHACQACGSCCSSTDVGPINSLQAQRINSHDWTDIIPDLKTNEDVFRTAQFGDQSIILTAMRNDQCIFLSDDKLCLVHRHLGVDSKPTQCRQFPYVFSLVNDRIDVSLSMECRAYWKAKKAATPPSEQQGMLRELLELGAPVHRISTSVGWDTRLMCSELDYIQWEERMIQSVQETENEEDVLASIQSMLTRSNELFSRISAPINKQEEAWVDPAQWATVFSCSDSSFVVADNAKRLPLRAILDALSQFSNQAKEVASERNLTALALRFNFLKNAAASAGGDINLRSFRWSEPSTAREIIRDVLISGLFSKAVPRLGTIQFGTSLLALRCFLMVYGACYRAQEACRVSVSVQDLIDSMVTLSKMLREEAVIEFLRDYEHTLYSALIEELVQSHRSSDVCNVQR